MSTTTTPKPTTTTTKPTAVAKPVQIDSPAGAWGTANSTGPVPADNTIVPEVGVFYGGQFVEVDVPEGYQITAVEAGEPTTTTVVNEEGKAFEQTTTPLEIQLSAKPEQTDALTSALEKYNAEPKITVNPSGGAGTSTSNDNFAIAEAKRWENYTPEEKVALQKYLNTQTVNDMVKLGVTVAAPLAFVAAPATAITGAAISTGASQAVKAIEGEGLLTPEEALVAAGSGAVFSVAMSPVAGAMGKAAPILAEKSLVGSAARIGTSTMIGAASGGSISAGVAVIQGANARDAFVKGAVVGGAVGLAVGVGGELVNAYGPALKSKVENFVNPDKAIVERALSTPEATGPTTEISVEETTGLKTFSAKKDVFGRYSLKEASAPASDTGVSTGGSDLPLFQTKKDIFGRTSLKQISTPKTSDLGTSSGGAIGGYRSGGGGGDLMSVVKVYTKPATSRPMTSIAPTLTVWKTTPLSEQSVTKSVTKIEAKPQTKEIPVVSLSLLESPKLDTPKLDVKTKVASTTTQADFSTTKTGQGFNPSVWQGRRFPNRFEQPVATDEDTGTIFNYPTESPIRHPDRIDDAVSIKIDQGPAIGGFNLGGIGESKFLEVPNKPPVVINKDDMASSIFKKGKDESDIKIGPSFDQWGISETSIDLGGVLDQPVRQDQRQRQRSSTVNIPKFNFDRSPPRFTGFKLNVGGRSRSAKIPKIGRQGRIYPIMTGEDTIKSLLKRTSKKGKGKGGLW